MACQCNEGDSIFKIVKIKKVYTFPKERRGKLELIIFLCSGDYEMFKENSTMKLLESLEAVGTRYYTEINYLLMNTMNSRRPLYQHQQRIVVAPCRTLGDIDRYKNKTLIISIRSYPGKKSGAKHTFRDLQLIHFNKVNFIHKNHQEKPQKTILSILYNHLSSTETPRFQ